MWTLYRSEPSLTLALGCCLALLIKYEALEPLEESSAHNIGNSHEKLDPSRWANQCKKCKRSVDMIVILNWLKSINLRNPSLTLEIYSRILKSQAVTGRSCMFKWQITYFFCSSDPPVDRRLAALSEGESKLHLKNIQHHTDLILSFPTVVKWSTVNRWRWCHSPPDVRTVSKSTSEYSSDWRTPWQQSGEKLQDHTKLTRSFREIPLCFDGDIRNRKPLKRRWLSDQGKGQ